MAIESAAIIYGVAWIIFGALHSALASDTLKHRLQPLAGPRYRVVYNLFAIISFGVLLFIGLQLFQGHPAIDWGRRAKVWLGLIEISGWVLLFLAAGHYDMARFSGLAQLKERTDMTEPSVEEPLQTKGLHRYVRHPLYSATFLILWGAVWTPFGLATAVFGSLYLLIGTWSEERKLVAVYGSDYAAYRAKVPAFIPWRGRAI